MGKADPICCVLYIRCICGLLKNKPRILVTHQLQYLNAADQIVVLKEVRACKITLYTQTALYTNYTFT